MLGSTGGFFRGMNERTEAGEMAGRRTVTKLALSLQSAQRSDPLVRVGRPVKCAAVRPWHALGCPVLPVTKRHRSERHHWSVRDTGASTVAQCPPLHYLLSSLAEVACCVPRPTHRTIVSNHPLTTSNVDTRTCTARAILRQRSLFNFTTLSTRASSRRLLTLPNIPPFQPLPCSRLPLP